MTVPLQLPVLAAEYFRCVARGQTLLRERCAANYRHVATTGDVSDPDDRRCSGCVIGAQHAAGRVPSHAAPTCPPPAADDELPLERDAAERLLTCQACGKTWSGTGRGRPRKLCLACRGYPKARAKALPASPIPPPAPPQAQPEAPDNARETTDRPPDDQEPNMRTTTCSDCDKSFRVQSDTGRMPTRCAACKGASSSSKPPRPAKRTEPATAPKGGGARPAIGEVSLEELIQTAAARTALAAELRAVVSQHPRELALEGLAVVIGELRAEG